MRKRKNKKQTIDFLKDNFNQAKGYIIFSLLNLKASILNNLRLEVKENNGLIEVPKKTFLYKANPDFPFSDEEIKEPIAILWAFDDDLKSFRLIKLIKDETEIKILGGCILNNKLSSEKIWEIINLPDKEILYQRLLNVLILPIFKTQFTLNQPIKKLIFTLSAIKEKLK